MIRTATADDMDILIALGRKMHAESPRFSLQKFCPDVLRATLEQLLAIDGGILLLYERHGQAVGGFVGLINQDWYSSDLVANDYALFVDPEYRGGIAAARLVKRYIDIAKARGVHPEFIQIGVSTGVHLTETELFFTRLGLRQYGSIWRVI